MLLRVLLLTFVLTTYSVYGLTIDATAALITRGAKAARQTVFPPQRFAIPYNELEKLAMYETTELSKRMYSIGFGKILNPILKRVVDNHPRKDELLGLFREKGEPEVQHHYVTVRDGVRLSTLVFLPPGLMEGEKRAAMMSRSPYGPTSDQVADLFVVMNGFVSVVQDQRGTFFSEGKFSMWTHDSEDGYDTIEWIGQQPWSNKDVYTAGISADGCGSAAMLTTQPKHLKGQLLMWASANGHKSTYPGGAFRAGLITGWMTLQAPLTHGVSLKETLPQLLREWKLAPGGFWQPIQGPGHPNRWQNVRWDTVHIAGWWDIFSTMQFEMYNGLRAESSKEYEHRLVVGPIGHCLLGYLDPALDEVEARAIEVGYGLASEMFGKTESRHFRDMLDLINVYVMGSRGEGRRGKGKVGHFWSSFKNWPQIKSTKLYLGSGRSLSFSAPEYSSLRAGSNNEFVTFQYNPTMPSQTLGGNNLVLHMIGYYCASEDQRKVEARPDVVAFDLTAPLTESLALTGKVKAVLFVSTDAKDTDFYVSITDVHPTGESMQIRNGLQRLRLRDSTPIETIVSEVEAGHIYRVEIDLWETSYIIAPGHRLRVSVTSASSPFYGKNDNTGADDDQYGLKRSVVAENRVYFSSKYPSYVDLPVVDIKDLPRNSKI